MNSPSLKDENSATKQLVKTQSKRSSSKRRKIHVQPPGSLLYDDTNPPVRKVILPQFTNQHEINLHSIFFVYDNKPDRIPQILEPKKTDFQTPIMIGKRVDADFEQLKFGHGYDHNWILKQKTNNEPKLAAIVYEPSSERLMEETI